jgi:60 kDa SS-A/Ro ribonucleoprotein
LRNLRNIIIQAPEIINEALEILTDEFLIKKSLVLPFRFLTAYEELLKLHQGSIVRKTIMSLNNAVDIATCNVPKFEGETLVVLDVSGSMQMNNLGTKSPHIIGALFSAVLVKSNNCDFMAFSDDAQYHNINPMDSTLTIANSLRFSSGGTNFHSIFKTAYKKYDRIIILSDMQGWIGNHSPDKVFEEYKTNTKSNPFVYSFDLQNYGSMQFPEKNVFAIAGFSEKIFDIMTLMEKDKKALIHEIEKIEF